MQPSHVRSTPLTSAPARRQETHLIPQSGIVRLMIFMLRALALALLAASTFGNYVPFAGGWDHVRWSWHNLPASIAAISWSAVAFAIIFQFVFSVFQWGCKAKRWWALYALALLASAIPSFLTYNAWAGPYLTAQIGAVLSVLAIGLATVGADALPEWVLVG